VISVGLPAASLVILRFALFAPRLVGVNVTLIVQLPPAATAVFAQVLELTAN
jgi:hypothetical protein